MNIACVSLTGRGATDLFLMQVVARLEARHMRLAGTVQSNTERPGRLRCDMDLRVLPDGPDMRISEDRGDLARGCRLDSGVLEQTVVEVLSRIDGAELLIINKFGKRECEGKGLVPVIAEAVGREMPVLVGVNGLNLDELRAFAGDALVQLPGDVDHAVQWCLAARLALVA